MPAHRPPSHALCVIATFANSNSIKSISTPIPLFRVNVRISENNSPGSPWRRRTCLAPRSYTLGHASRGTHKAGLHKHVCPRESCRAPLRRVAVVDNLPPTRNCKQAPCPYVIYDLTTFTTLDFSAYPYRLHSTTARYRQMLLLQSTSLTVINAFCVRSKANLPLQ